METVHFSVIEGKEEAFERIYKRLKGFCDLNDLTCNLKTTGSEEVDYMITYPNGSTKLVTRKFNKYTFECEKMVSRRFIYVGELTRLKTTNNLNTTYSDIELLGGIEIPEEYNTKDLLCDHCNNGRRCSITKLFYDTTEKQFTQIARGCSVNYDYLDARSNIHNLFVGLDIPPSGTRCYNRSIK